MMQQHGDVVIKKIACFPSGIKKPIMRKARGWVLADGELSGHAHVIEEDIELVEINGVLYMRNSDTVTIKHEEHKPQTIEPGTYEIGIVKEYDPFEKEIRNVQD